jgi:hypothetical protein
VEGEDKQVLDDVLLLVSHISQEKLPRYRAIRNSCFYDIYIALSI